MAGTECPVTFTGKKSIPDFKEELSVTNAWVNFARCIEEDSLDVALKQMHFSESLSSDFRDIVTDLEQSKVPKEDFERVGREHIRNLILDVRKLRLDVNHNNNFESIINNTDESVLSQINWKNVFKNIIFRIQNESTYFNDAATTGALEITQNRLLSKQLTAIIIPIENKFLQKIIPQPVFFTDIGLILHPGHIPTTREVAQKLAHDGKLPSSFAKLQESVADILSWPKYRRVLSFVCSATVGLLTIPFSLAAKVLIYVPRILGTKWLKKNALSMAVDPVLNKAFGYLCSNGQHSVSLHRKTQVERLIGKLSKDFPEENKTKIAVASRNIIELRALGYNLQQIGSLIHGCKFDKDKKIFPKLEKAILDRCDSMKINSTSGRKHLIELDDAAWRLSFTESRLSAMKIAQEEISKAISALTTTNPQKM